MKDTRIEGSEGLKIGGYFEWIVRDREGNIKAMGRTHNLVVNNGLAEIAGLMLTDVGGTAFDYLALGTDATTPSATDTALGAEISDSGLARTAGTGTRVTNNVTNDTAKLSATWTATATKSIKEVGVFNAASGGTMLARSNIDVTVNNGDQLTVNYKVTCSAS